MDFQTPDYEAVAPGAFQTPDHEAVAEQPDEGALMAAGRGALRNFPFAQQGVAAIEPGKYAENLRNLVSKAEAAKSAHPYAYGTGAAAGTAAPLLIPAAGEALAAAPMLGNAALGAAQSLSDADLTNPTPKDAENAALAGAIGGGVGAIGKGLSSMIAAPAKEIASEVAPEVAPEVTEAVAPKVVPKAVAGRAIPDRAVAPDFVPSGERIAASNVAQGLGGTPRQLLKIMGKDPISELNNIGDWLSTADNGKSLVKLMDRPGALLDKVQGLHDEAGKKIGEIIDEIVGPNIPPAQNGVSSEARTVLDAKLNDIAGKLHLIEPQSEPKVLNLLERINTLDNEGKLTFDKLQDLKSNYGEAMQRDPNMIPVFGALSDYVNDTVEQFGKQIGEPALKATYDAAKVNYHNSSKIMPILRYAEAKELVGGPAGHFSLRGLLAHLVDAASSVSGVPTPAKLVQNTLLKTAPQARTIGNAASAASRGLSKSQQLELTNALQSRFGNRKPQ